MAKREPWVRLEVGPVKTLESALGTAGWLAVHVRPADTDRGPLADLEREARQSPAAELTRVRAEFFRDGPGKAVRDLEGRLAAAEADAASAAAEVGTVRAEWERAVAAGADTADLDARLSAAKGKAELAASRVPIIRAVLGRAKAEAAAALRGLLAGRAAELRAAADGRLAAAKAAVEKPTTWPLAELILARANAGACVALDDGMLDRLAAVE